MRTHVLEEDLEDTTSLLVDETGDTLHTTTACKTANSRLCNALNVIAKNLAVTLSTTLSEALESKSVGEDVWWSRIY